MKADRTVIVQRNGEDERTNGKESTMALMPWTLLFEAQKHWKKKRIDECKKDSAEKQNACSAHIEMENIKST